MSEYLSKRSTHGVFKLTLEISDNVFRKSFRLNRVQFDGIHELIKGHIIGIRDYNGSISSEEKLSVCLRYLATGDMFKTIAMSYRMGKRTVSSIVSQVCKAIWRHLQPVHMPKPTVEMWEEIALDF
ncbi:uncharacterized protein LOC120352702 [Nilaparvata lugens]|uniref:uncharacterized protein LOC120352702 n=1 Tax=Nilaparvata lugens TaxID=108931 RepID=UPI00193CCC50|nr:uncharacterized protein LOC120352702 [Nilaparvata lugens]